MKLLCVALAAVLSAALAPTPAHAQSGFILVGHAANQINDQFGGHGVVQDGAACDETSLLNGVDGRWFKLSDLGSGGSVRVSPGTPMDIGIKMFAKGGSCAQLGGSTNGPLLAPGTAVTKTIPQGATHVFVFAFYGAGTLEISRF